VVRSHINPSLRQNEGFYDYSDAIDLKIGLDLLLKELLRQPWICGKPLANHFFNSRFYLSLIEARANKMASAVAERYPNLSQS
jgi:hypothetical protein